MRIPAAITKGDSTAWDDDPTVDNLGQAVDSSSYTLTYEIRGAVSLTLTAVAEGSGWRTTLSTANSDTLSAGTYYWQAVATKTGARVTLGSGQLQVKPNLGAISQTYDGRSQAQQDLDAVQAALRALVQGGAKSYTIGTRSMTKLDIPDLLALESRLKAMVKRERKDQDIANGLGSPHNVFVRF